MLQAIGLTSTHRRDLPPAVDDLTFEARSGCVTALLGAPGSGKTTALRLMLELESGRGVTYFRGNPLHSIAHPAREVGVLLGDVPGHPARTARGQLRLLCAAAGVPVSRADEMLDVVGLAGLGGRRLGTLSLGMDRRLGFASALLGDPQTLILDEPSKGLSPRENSWLSGLLRTHASYGGTVLYTTSDPKEAARLADRVVTLDGGRLVADQDAAADSQALRLVYGSDLTPVLQNWPALIASWGGLAVGCAWAGLLAAGVFRVAAAGVAAVLAVPVLIAPLVQKALVVPSARSIAGLPSRLRELAWVQLPQQADLLLMAVVRLVAQPVGAALTLSLSALICAYLFTGLRRGARW
ncbi:ATP-binding cassette domain-containing protein [Streptomyces lunaelactis]|uniref:ATP-binding cassette domain-containing protein n=1 Tax=Streptomyces lunaelactis TaxID=1535768 RepID=UPI0015856ED8|nr:ATP-binding cassette domain-containing protein [Streptomyces lunaelactis]NUK24304.1 ATP-binding cassette domain-containing protein [Streptomyces lunaelactis]